MALLYGAQGGVYLGRGITPKIVEVLDSDLFRKAFTDKGAMSDYLASIPVYAIMANDAGLRGAALAVSERFPMEPLV
jgi:glucokinase